MTDNLDRATRSRTMSAVRSKDSGIELLVRSYLHKTGFRFRVHKKGLPGSPDLFLRRWRAAVFVNGCFWHGHDCGLFKAPTSNSDFWANKIRQNRQRDKRVVSTLSQNGFRVLVVWECAFRGREKIGIEAALSSITDWLRSSATLGEVRGSTL